MAPSALLPDASPPPVDLAVKMKYHEPSSANALRKSGPDDTVVELLEGGSVDEALAQARDRFTSRNPRSLECHIDSCSTMPGGNTRTMLHTTPFPVFLKSGKDYQVTSEDGHTYTDFVGELTAAVFGHSHPVILDSIRRTLSDVGMNLGGQTRMEHAHALAMCARFGLEQVRFTNCGTEANIHALAAARAFTNRRKVVVFGGGYHGGVLAFSGGKAAVNVIDRDDFIVVPYNDVAAMKEAVDTSVAAVLVEGMQGSAGAIVGQLGFLHAIQIEARKHGAVFILDEVMTSRLDPGGLARKMGLNPDIKIFGKYLGGGLAFGAFGGRADIMAVFDPRKAGAIAHHGTFNNNTLAMAAGHAGLTQVYTPAVCDNLNEQGWRLLSRLNAVTSGTKMVFTGIGAVMASHFTADGQPLVRETQEDEGLKQLFWLEMMEDGFWITKRGSIALMLGTPAEELDQFVYCVDRFVARHIDMLKI